MDSQTGEAPRTYVRNNNGIPTMRQRSGKRDSRQSVVALSREFGTKGTIPCGPLFFDALLLLVGLQLLLHGWRAAGWVAETDITV